MVRHSPKRSDSERGINTKEDRIPGVCVCVLSVCACVRASLTMAAMVCSSFSTKSTFLAEVSDASTPLWPRHDSLALSYVSFAVRNFRQEFPTRCQLSPHTFSGGRNEDVGGEEKGGRRCEKGRRHGESREGVSGRGEKEGAGERRWREGDGRGKRKRGGG